MCTHLDKVIPDDLKLWLHQAFWKHRRACARCDGIHSQTSWAWENTVCSLERFISRPEPQSEEKEAEGSVKKKARSGSPKPAVDKRLSSEEEIAKWIAKGYVLRKYVVDDDFDAAENTGKERLALVPDHSAEEFDVVEEVEIFVEEIPFATKKI